MKNWKTRHRRPHLFGILYGLALTAATSFVLLDTFVIPKAEVVVSQSSGTRSSAVTRDTNAASDTSGGTADQSGGDSAEASANKDTENSAGVSGTGGSSKTTDHSYSDNNVSISIETKRVNETTVYIADVQISDISYLKTAFASGTYGRNIKETTSDMAGENNAILAINGDYYGFRDSGYVLRNGTLYRSDGNGGEDLAVNADGTMRIVEEKETSAEELESEGVLQVFSFGPALINNGEVTVDADTEVSQSMNSNPRTAIGMISPLHYKLVVSDGRTSESEGLTLLELANVMKDEGCTVAYNLDGGGSSTLWFNGKVVNSPTDGRRSGERKVSDIIYIGQAVTHDGKN